MLKNNLRTNVANVESMSIFNLAVTNDLNLVPLTHLCSFVASWWSTKTSIHPLERHVDSNANRGAFGKHNDERSWAGLQCMPIWNKIVSKIVFHCVHHIYHGCQSNDFATYHHINKPENTWYRWTRKRNNEKSNLNNMDPQSCNWVQDTSVDDHPTMDHLVRAFCHLVLHDWL